MILGAVVVKRGLMQFQNILDFTEYPITELTRRSLSTGDIDIIFIYIKVDTDGQNEFLVICSQNKNE